MTTAWIAQQQDPSMAELSFDERLALLVEAETLARDIKRLAKLLHDAKLRVPSACVEDIDLSPKRELDRAVVRQLATGQWIAEHANVLVTGMTSVAVGDLVKVRLWHFELTAREPAEAHAVVEIDGMRVLDARVAIPGPGGLIKAEVRIARAVPAGAPIYFHLHNHGQNSWALVEISTGP